MGQPGLITKTFNKKNLKDVIALRTTGISTLVMLMLENLGRGV